MINYNCDFCGSSIPSKYKIYDIYLRTDYWLTYDLCKSCYKEFSKDLLKFVLEFKAYKKSN